MAESVFPSKDLAKLSYDFVAVIAHNRPNHGEGDWIHQGEKKHLCNIYDVSSCKVHEQMAMELQKKNLLKGVRGTPTHIMYDPHDLTEISRAHGMSVSDIEDAVKAAQRKLGKPILWRVYGKLKAELEEIRKLVAEDELRDALRDLKRFDAEEIEAIETEAKELREAVFEAGRKKIAEARCIRTRFAACSSRSSGAGPPRR